MVKVLGRKGKCSCSFSEDFFQARYKDGLLHVALPRERTECH